MRFKTLILSSFFLMNLAQAAAEHDMYKEQNLWPGSCQRGKLPDQRQSPIALEDKLFKGKKSSPISFAYKPADADIVDDGHTIKYNFKGDAGSLTFEGKTYALKQFHFHKQSEHTLNGKGHDMEVHFVHTTEENGKPKAIALGFFIDQSKPTDEWFKTFSQLPKPVKVDKKVEGATVLASIKDLNVRSLIPSKETYYVYEGSLTTPNCEEFVTHIVGKDPIGFSKEMEDSYASFHNKSNRNIQPTGDAKIRKFRTALEN